MNICFVIGKVVDEIEFKFVLNGRNDAIANFNIKLLNNSIINIIAYNKLADYCYRKLKINDIIFVEGRLNLKLDMVAEKIIRWKDDVRDERRKK